MSESTKFESNLEVTPRSDCELACHRDFKANSQDIYAAIRDPEKLARWWGPRAGQQNQEI